MKLTDCGVMANLNQNLDTDNSCTFSHSKTNKSKQLSKTVASTFTLCL